MNEHAGTLMPLLDGDLSLHPPSQQGKTDAGFGGALVLGDTRWANAVQVDVHGFAVCHCPV